MTYHIYGGHWSDAVYKYVNIHNSWFNCREQGKQELLIEAFYWGSSPDSFQTPERRNEAGSMWRRCSEPSEERLVHEWSPAHRSEHLNNDPTQGFITKATLIPQIPACFHGSRRRWSTGDPAVLLSVRHRGGPGPTVHPSTRTRVQDW